MRTLLTILAFSLVTLTGVSQNNFINLADSFLKKNVIEGRVDYKSIAENPTELYALVNIITLQDVPEMDRKAYLINAYNILVISNIVTEYPVLSPQEISGFFENKNQIVANKKMSLNGLEKDLLFKVYNDPRLHFVLVCGALGCPPITNFAYRTDILEEQLNTQSHLALNSDFVKVADERKTVFLSEIFKWYVDDFGGNNKSSIDYINNFRKNKIPSTYKVAFYDYDWRINVQENSVKTHISINSAEIGSSNNSQTTNLQTFTAGSLLRKNQYDLTLFNTLYTESKSNWMGESFDGFRNTFVTHLAQITYGVSKNKRINLGLDLNFRYNGTIGSDDAFSGISEAFKFENSPSSRIGLTAIGLRFKVQPFKTVSDFSIQSTIQAPIIKSPEGNSDLYWADWDRITWWNQFFYTKTFGDFQLFTEIDLLFRFAKYDTQIGMLDIPTSVFLSYFPNSKITLYAMSQHMARLTNNISPVPQGEQPTDWVIPANYTASGLGAKYQITSQMNLEILYSNFWRGTNNGLGNTFNLGIKYISK
ncbi:MAG: DUF547 domain-containing protein [Crocinitomicaceae bacterium]